MKKKKEMKVSFIESVNEKYEQWKEMKDKQSLVSAIDKKVNELKKNPQIGQPIGKSLIPKIWKNELGINNLWRLELPMAYRLQYSITSPSEIEIVSLVLAIDDHKEYNRKYGFKKG